MAKDGHVTESVVVTLQSQADEVNAAAVSATMSAVVALIMEAQHEIAENEQLLIKARPFAKGSFEIPLDLVVVAAGTMFANSPLIENILDIVRRYFEIRRSVRGDANALEGQMAVTGEEQQLSIDSVVANLLSPTSLTSHQIAVATQELTNDPTVAGVSIRRGDDKVPFVTVRRSEFQYFMTAIGTSLRPNERSKHSRETLSIASIVFEGNGKWRFNRRGHIIAAKIVDKDFVERVQTGVEVFRAGDRLDVALLVMQSLDLTTNDYVNKTYVVERVFGHDKRKSQQTMLDE